MRNPEAEAEEPVYASAPLGRRGAPLNTAPRTNSPGAVLGRAYSGHAFDQMQSRGVTPTVVEDTIKTGVKADSRDGTTTYTSSANGVQVVLNKEGKVVTVITVEKTKPR